MATAGQLGIDALLQRRQASVLQPGRLGPGTGSVGNIGQGRSPPQGQGRPQGRRCFGGRAGPRLAPGRGHQRLEPDGVEVLGRDQGHVAGRPGHNHTVTAGLPQRFAQTGHEHLQRMGRSLRWIAAPEVVGQTLGRHHAVRRCQQQGQHGPLPAPPENHRPAVVDDLHRPEDAELHAAATSSLRTWPSLTGPPSSLRAPRRGRWGLGKRLVTAG